jgi:two-component system, OmpR family, sensor kinase
MSNDQAARVFERFFRADPSRSRLSGGAGLGMAIVHALVTAHGGHISVETSPGHGVRITVSLPLETIDESRNGDGSETFDREVI